MQSISKIFKSYKDTLDNTYNQQLDNISKIRQRVEDFYKIFLKNLIINYGEIIRDNHKNFLIKENVEKLFGKDNIKFVAIDGSSFKEEFSEFMVFYGGAYAIRGSIKLKDHTIEYEKWDIKYDKSIVAYIPISYLDLNIENEDMFFTSDKEKIEFLNIHNQLMQLAEVYLAYNFISSADNDINLVLMDNSLSSMFLSNDVLHAIDELKIVNYKFRRNYLTKADIFISYAMPINEELGIPSCKNFHGEFYIIRKLFNNSTMVNNCPFINDKHINRLKKFEIISSDSTTEIIKINKNLLENTKESWEFVKDFYRYICEELFVNKNIEILKHNNKWLTSNDIKFLISVGIRMIIEESWKREVLVIGIAKDSSSKYFIRNYLGVMKQIGVYKFEAPGIVASDRLVLEYFPFIDKNILAPWSSIEFDSVFMSLHLEKEDEKVFIAGFRGDIIVPQERLFLRSLAQFYVNRNKNEPLTGNVIFIDRISHPIFDKKNLFYKFIETNRKDKIKPIFYKDKYQTNEIQQALIYILDALTKNLFPNVIGYPDPLHKADWGAKSMNRKIRELIKSSEIKFLSNPLKKSFRQKRGDINV